MCDIQEKGFIELRRNDIFIIIFRDLKILIQEEMVYQSY